MTETTTVGCLSPEIEGLLLDVLADGFTRITAARAPKRGNVDIFAPEVVVWAYEEAPQWTLRALLNLVHPQHPDAPHGEYPAPPSLHIRRAEQRPMTIRLPSPDRTEAQARRLTPEPPVPGRTDAMVGR